MRRCLLAVPRRTPYAASLALPVMRHAHRDSDRIFVWVMASRARRGIRSSWMKSDIAITVVVEECRPK
jgi:hypothetical protein